MLRLAQATALLILEGLVGAGCGGLVGRSPEGNGAGGAGGAEPSVSGSGNTTAKNDGGRENTAVSNPLGGTAGAVLVGIAGAAEGGGKPASGAPQAGLGGTAGATAGGREAASGGTAGASGDTAVGPVAPLAGAAGDGSGTVGCGPASGGTGGMQPDPGSGGANTGGLGGGTILGGTAGDGAASGAAGTTSPGAAGASGSAPTAGAAGHEPGCADLIQNGDETDVDCGGADCQPCAALMLCKVGEDCISGVCTASLCQTPVCNDGVRNGTEACDGNDLAGATCGSLDLGTGTLGCSADCEFVTSGCGSAWTCGDPLVDARDDKAYATIALGGLCWMASNLDAGERIQTNQVQSATDRIQKYCYGDNETMCTQFGGLYQWDHAMQYSDAEGATGICPAGWRIPTDQNWKELEIALGMDPAVADQDDWRGVGVGTALKVGGSSGFEAPLSGMAVNGNSYNYPDYGYFWTSTLGTPGPWRRCLTSGSAYPKDTVGRWQTWGRHYALPIRCVTEEGE